MSMFSDISKRIGWEGNAEIPTVEQARQMLLQTRNGNATQFEQVFRVHRFAKECNSDHDIEAMNIIWEAFKIGQEIFKNKEGQA